MAKAAPVTSLRMSEGLKRTLRLRGVMSVVTTNMIRRYLWLVDAGRRTMPHFSDKTLSELERAFPPQGASQTWSISALRRHLSEHITSKADRSEFDGMSDIHWLALLDCLDCTQTSFTTPGHGHHLRYWIEQDDDV